MRTAFLAAAVAALPLLAAADAADPAAEVPRSTYRSVLPQHPTDLAEPDLPWRAANEAVGRFPRGHADIVKWENGQAVPAMPASAPRPPASGSR